ncbi:hypothetical protein BGX31_005578 [Mortierella sp. GBA43]|nr:hypothetical protein BGX31_005578 [Mortierella sp. GBA43]
MNISSAHRRNAEAQFFDLCWAVANPGKQLHFPGDRALQFFSKSGLDNAVLASIWQIADKENRGYLDRCEFDIALRLIGHAQDGFKVTQPIPQGTGSLPRFETRVSTLFGPAIVDLIPPPSAPGADSFYAAFPTYTPPSTSGFDSAFPESFPPRPRTPPSTSGFDSAFQDPAPPLPPLPPLPPSAFDSDFDSAFQDPFHFSSSDFDSDFDPTFHNRASEIDLAFQDSIKRPAPNTNAPSQSKSPNLDFQSPTPAPQITKSDIEQTRALFQAGDLTNGRMSGDDARDILLGSGLSMDVLAQIWQVHINCGDLADIHNNGTLDLVEFAIALHYSRQVLAQPSSALPNKLPSQVLEAFKDALKPQSQTKSLGTFWANGAPSSGSSSVSSPSTSTSATNVFPIKPLPKSLFASLTPPPPPPAITATAATTPSLASYDAHLEEHRKILAQIQANQEEQTRIQMRYMEELLKQQQEQAKLMKEKLEPLFQKSIDDMAKQLQDAMSADTSATQPLDITGIINRGTQHQKDLIDGYLSAISSTDNAKSDNPFKAFENLSVSDKPTGINGSNNDNAKSDNPFKAFENLSISDKSTGINGSNTQSGIGKASPFKSESSMSPAPQGQPVIICKFSAISAIVICKFSAISAIVICKFSAISVIIICKFSAISSIIIC